MSDDVMAQDARRLRATYIGGPTVLIEFGGVRLLTDPTFDPAGSEYTTPVYTLHKTQSPAVSADDIGAVDAVLLSHDHHFDNFDRLGRKLALRSPKIITTVDGATRLGAPAIGLRAWESTTIAAPDGRTLHVTATPARHGPPDGDRGPVIGFLLAFEDAHDDAHDDAHAAARDDAVYVSGDTVWYDGVAEVAARFRVRAAFLNLGAARVKEVGPAHLTLSAAESVDAARAFPNAVIVPLHYEGWQHFSEGREPTDAALRSASLTDRVRWLEPGRATAL